MLVELVIKSTIYRVPDIGQGLCKYIIYPVLILAIQQSNEIGNKIFFFFLKDLFLEREREWRWGRSRGRENPQTPLLNAEPDTGPEIKSRMPN